MTLNPALSYYKVRYYVGTSQSTEMVIPAMSGSQAREIFQNMMPTAKIVSVLRIAGPGMNRRTP